MDQPVCPQSQKKMSPIKKMHVPNLETRLPISKVLVHHGQLSAGARQEDPGLDKPGGIGSSYRLVIPRVET